MENMEGIQALDVRERESAHLKSGWLARTQALRERKSLSLRMHEHRLLITVSCMTSLLDVTGHRVTKKDASTEGFGSATITLSSSWLLITLTSSSIAESLLSMMVDSSFSICFWAVFGLTRTGVGPVWKKDGDLMKVFHKS